MRAPDQPGDCFVASFSVPSLPVRFSLPRLPQPQTPGFLRPVTGFLAEANPHLLGPFLIAAPALLIGASIELLGNAELGRGIAHGQIIAPASGTSEHEQSTAHDAAEAERIAESLIRLRPAAEDDAPKLPGIGHDTGETSTHGASESHESRSGGQSDTITPSTPPFDTADPRQGARVTSSEALPPAPLSGLTRPGPGGLLPAISPSGEHPSDAYARPFSNRDNKPAIALMVRGLGLSSAISLRAIDELPADVTLSFSAYSPDLQEWIDRARADGHEVVLEMPMEPFDFPRNDPGPHTLLADGSPGENRRRIDWLMARATGYFAVTNHQGARFVTARAATVPLMGALRERGVALIYDGETPRAVLAEEAASRTVPFLSAHRVLDAQPTPDGIDRELIQVEARAIQHGGALGIIQATPLALETISDWIARLPAKGYVLAPASALTDVPRDATSDAESASDDAPEARVQFSTERATFADRGEADGEKDAKKDKHGKDGKEEKGDAHH